MNPEKTLKYNSLSWVKEQLDVVLVDAQVSLSEYIENHNESYMQQCVEHLKLVYGTLQMVEVYGAAMLAEEMQHTAVVLQGGAVENIETAYDVLMRAMLQLPDYLENIQAGAKDTPIILMSLINDLRVARNDHLLSESVLFVANTDGVELNTEDYDSSVIETGKLAAEVKRLRKHFQLGLLDVIRNQKVRSGLQRIKAVLKALEKVSYNDEVRRLWMVAGALVEGLLIESIDNNISVKMLLTALDRQLKKILDKDEEVFLESYSRDLLKNMLYYIGICKTDNPRIQAVQKAYKLEEFIPSEDEQNASVIGGLNANLFDTVSKGIAEDLFQVKDALEIFMHNGAEDVGSLKFVCEQLSKIADTFGMLSMGMTRQSIIEQRNIIDRIICGDEVISESLVLGVAEKLLNAESDLKVFITNRSGYIDQYEGDDQIVPNSEYRQVILTVVDETLKNFTVAKEALLSYIAGIGNKEQLDVILNKLEEVRGVALMLPLGRIESQIDRLKNYVRIALRDNDRCAESEEQDRVADVVTAIEYYIEALSEGRPGIDEGLDSGDRAAEKLKDIYSQYGEKTDSLNDEINNQNNVTGEAEAEAVDTDVVGNEIIETEADDLNAETFDAHAVMASESLPASNELIEIEETSIIVPPDLNAELTILIDDADEEIVEIFIEEAIEVLEELHNFVPQWKENHNNEEAKANIRRSFHTLKGSGRLIGAELIGEFSWRFENVLNRVIDKKISVSANLFNTIDEALAVLPQLIEQLQGNREPIPNINALMAAADALAEGKEIVSTEQAPAKEPIFDAKDSDDTNEALVKDLVDGDAEIDFDELDGVIASDSSENQSGEETFTEEEAIEIILLTDNEDGEAMPASDFHESVGGEEIVMPAADTVNIGNIIDATDDADNSPDKSSVIAETGEITALGEADSQALEITSEGLNSEIELEETGSESQLNVESADDIEILNLDTTDASNNSAEDFVDLNCLDADSSDEVECEPQVTTEIDESLVDGKYDVDVIEEISIDEAEITHAADDEVNDVYVVEIDESKTAELTGANVLDIDPMLLKIYYDESKNHLLNVHELLRQHKSGEKNLTAEKNISRAFHTLYGSARTAEVSAIAEISGATEKYLKAKQGSSDENLGNEIVDLFEEIEATLEHMLTFVKIGEMPEGDKALLEKINKALQQEIQAQLQSSLTTDVAVDEAFVSDAAEMNAIKLDDESHQGKAVAEFSKAEPSAAEEPKPVVVFYADIDDELIDIFLEEAEELLEGCEKVLQSLRQAPNSAESIQKLQRNMHTLKGGARMAELIPVGDLTHVLESLVVLISEQRLEINKDILDLLQESVDTLTSMMAEVKQRKQLDSVDGLIKKIELFMRGEVEEKRSIERFELNVSDLDEIPESDAVLPYDQNDQSSTAENDAAKQQPTSDGLKTGKPHWGERATDVNFVESQEQVRVRSDLLNNLVNYAGEVNIYHARLGKQVSDFSFNLLELSQTVERLKEQLRKLEIETEIQIRSGYEKEADEYDEGFDPLEMDRYSTLQQLSRSLMETAGDVESINNILSEITRDSETLLLQESRVSTDLQEGLMRTRMVRFGGLSSRMRRIVRQISKELNKEVELSIVGEDSEIDRTVLDRIIAPLEHMLRNAVAHGIEEPDKRLASGKSEVGRITVTVGRQGADVTINVKDDGAGINVGKIRDKITAQGLISPKSKVSDHEVLQFILHAGFSTVDEVTQISGRGVGMDVVDSEIKQLGGVLEINTIAGRGTEFNIRLPLTLAINQALLVSTGEDVYAVPLTSIEGVVRMTGMELQRYYDSPEGSLFEFNGVEYELKHLGAMLTGVQLDYSKQLRLFPVLLINVGEKNFALHVDDLIGRREIVVKPVGMQIGGVHGISGATILADGRVVLILEMSALITAKSLFRSQQTVDVTQHVKPKERLSVMVVDDSITIRKVTERILGRNGFDVVLAKDGIDATNKMQDHIPDLMLLDIEMPRMDGFEVASYVRNDEKLKGLPIIMITSRTGSKHKEKAMEIGVNHYLGKPYQEEELMNNINSLLNLVS